MGFWCVQAVITAVLEMNKRGHKDKVSLIDALIPYLNEENANALIERYIGISPKYEEKVKSKVNTKK